VTRAHVLDHVFVLCAEGAPEAEALKSLGVREGSPNRHPGQGTACRRFFFENVYLELLWVADPVEARSPLTLPTRLFERWSRRLQGASPFGVILRSAGPGPSDPPFHTWPYRPTYLPPPLSIDVASGTLLSEPELFHFRAPRRPGDLAAEPIAHALPLRSVSRVSVGIPGAEPRSDALRATESAGLVSFPTDSEHVLTLEFGEGEERRADLRPKLPLVLRYGAVRSST